MTRTRANETKRLSGHVAIVTGASSGIGKAVATRLASEGAKVVVTSRSVENCELVAEQIRAKSGAAIAIGCDVTCEQSVAHLFEQAKERFGVVNIAVANAGISGGKQAIADYPLERWESVIATNLTGVFLTCREAFRAMRMSTCNRRIIIVGSFAGIEAYAEKGAYCASKFGVRGLAHALAEEGRGIGISVSTICPGTVDTPILQKTSDTAKNPLHADTIADAALYLATLGENALVRDLVIERMITS